MMSKSRRELMPEDWEGRMKAMQELSKNIEATSKETRYYLNDQQLQLASSAKWTEYRTKNALFDRISEIKKLKIALEQCLASTRQEQLLLQEKLSSCENMEQDLLPCHDAVIQCVQIRDEKRSGELLNDKAHKELIMTSMLIKDLTRCLQNSSLECRNQEEQLQKCALDLESATFRQEESLKIDQNQLALKWTSPEVSFKPVSSTLQTKLTMIAKPIWETFLEDMFKKTYTCVEKSRGLRGEVTANMNVVRQELLKQKDTVEFALRQLIQTQQQMVQQLQWQKKYLEDEMEKCEKDLRETEKFRADSIKPLKLTQTRLVNRNQRPPLELCYDQAQHRLGDQIEFWNETHNQLHQQLNHSRGMVHQLQEQYSSVCEELRAKQEALELDKHCLEISNRFQLFNSGSIVKLSNFCTPGKSLSTPENFWQRALDKN